MKKYLARMRVYQWVATAGLMAFVMLNSSPANAQSGSKNAGSGARSAALGLSTNGTQVAMEGYCPVCIIEKKKWMPGSPAHRSAHDGQIYLFPGADQKAMFDANPAKYVPALGGDCVIAFKKMGKRIPGNIRQAAFHDNRLFLFSNKSAKGEFLANKEMYGNADVALGGNCSVCKIEMKQDVEGKVEFATNRKGMLYLFPSDKQRDMFIANPEKYAVSTSASQSQGSGSVAKGSESKGSSGK